MRLTTPSRPRLETWVVLGEKDKPFVGSVVCDDIGPIYKDQILKEECALHSSNMAKVEAAILVALDNVFQARVTLPRPAGMSERITDASNG